MTALLLMIVSVSLGIWALHYWWQINAAIAEMRGQMLAEQFFARVRESSASSPERATRNVEAVSIAPRTVPRERLIPAWAGAR